jgi:hypothetical protein
MPDTPLEERIAEIRRGYITGALSEGWDGDPVGDLLAHIDALAAAVRGIQHKRPIYVEENDYVSGFGDAKDAVLAILNGEH